MGQRERKRYKGKYWGECCAMNKCTKKKNHFISHIFTGIVFIHQCRTSLLTKYFCFLLLFHSDIFFQHLLSLTQSFSFRFGFHSKMRSIQSACLKSIRAECKKFAPCGVAKCFPPSQHLNGELHLDQNNSICLICLTIVLHIVVCVCSFFYCIRHKRL